MHRGFISPIQSPRRAVTEAGQKRRVERAKQMARASLLIKNKYRQEQTS